MVGHHFLPSPLHVLKAEADHGAMDCCDDDPRKVWIVIGGWSYRRAVLTHAEPFMKAAGTDDLMALEGLTFTASLDLLNPPPFEHEGGERLEWPDLKLARPLPEIREALGLEPPAE